MKENKSEDYDIRLFGDYLLTSNDLDPVYVLIQGSNITGSKLRKWLLAYWCFYHIGTASWIVDNKDYWGAMRVAAASKEYPRNTERRHFRGNNAINSVAYLESMGIEGLFNPITSKDVFKLDEIIKEVCKWVGFGPWISFKVADMLDRLAICEVEFDNTTLFLFDAPKKGAEELLRRYYYPPDKGTDYTTRDRQFALDRVVEMFSKYEAPPRYERTVNYQEAETILCKWKSHLGGHYKLGEDIVGSKQSLLRFARSKTSQHLLSVGRNKGLW